MIAIYGGTFDPIHLGHLRSAMEVTEALGLDELRLVPAFIPPLKPAPNCTPQQRLRMLRLGIAGKDALVIDERELKQPGRSYSVDTLLSIRAEIGHRDSLVMVMGCDVFARLDTWRDWRRLTDLAHLVILERPGFAALAGHIAGHTDVSRWAKYKWTKRREDLQTKSCGCIYGLRLSQLEISASMIRSRIGANKNVDFLMPENVAEYIQSNSLYADCA